MNTTEAGKGILTDEESRMKGVLSIYHPNVKGTGGALKVSIVPASEKSEGKVWMMAARQSVGGAPMIYTPSNVRHPVFGWDDAICASLGPVDAARLLMVFRGECESVNDGAGVFIRFPGEKCDAVKVTLRHVVEPVAGYVFEFIHSSRESGEKGAEPKTETVRVSLGAAEALVVSLALEQSMRLLAFGA